MILIVILLIGFFFLSGKNSKISSALRERLFPNQSGIVEGLKDIVPPVVSPIPQEKIDKLLEKGQEAFEKSPLNEPVQELKQNVQEKVNKIINETVQEIKELPAKEVKIIQREVCKQWLGEEFVISTKSGEPNGGN